MQERERLEREERERLETQHRQEKEQSRPERVDSEDYQLEIVEEDEENKENEFIQSNRVKPEKGKEEVKERFAYVVYNFQKQRDNDISLKKGEKIKVL